MDHMDINRRVHLKTRECMFFLKTHGNFSNMNCTLRNKKKKNSTNKRKMN